MVQSGEYMMSAGTFDDQSKQSMAIQVFIDEKPDGYDFANETKTMTGEELFALYAPED